MDTNQGQWLMGVPVWFVNDALSMVQIAPRWRDDDTPIFPHKANR